MSVEAINRRIYSIELIYKQDVKDYRHADLKDEHAIQNWNYSDYRYQGD